MPHKNITNHVINLFQLINLVFVLVFEYCDRFGVPVTLTMGGGYAENLDEIAAIHLNSVLIASGLPPQFNTLPTSVF